MNITAPNNTSNLHKAEIMGDENWNVQKSIMKGDFNTPLSLQERWSGQNMNMDNRTSKQHNQ